MQMTGIPFDTTDWSTVERTEHKGDTGVAYWRTRDFGGIRVRIVEYTPATSPITGARRDTSSCASRVSCTPSSKTAASSCSSPG
jgi:hypothetical protein